MFEFSFVFDNFLIAQTTDYQLRDLLVALVSIGLGLNIVYAVLTENERCYELGSVRMLERNFGKMNSRIILYFVGGLCLLMGAYLVGKATTAKRFEQGSRLSDSVRGFDVAADLLP